MKIQSEIDYNTWYRIREYHLNKLIEAKKRGIVDRAILPLLDIINEVEDFVTRSSCYGRILLLKQEGVPKKGKDIIVKKYHRPITLKELKKTVSRVEDGILWMNIESTIVHVAARSLDMALELYKIAYRSGYKKSSLISLSKRGITVEILEREKITIPIHMYKHNFTYSEDILNNLLNYTSRMFCDISTKMKKFIHDYSIYFKL